MADRLLHPFTPAATLRHTLASAVELTGVGLFTGRTCKLSMLPLHPAMANPDSPLSQGGIFFRHSYSSSGCTLFPATVHYLIPERRRTVLGHAPSFPPLIIVRSEELELMAPQVRFMGSAPTSDTAHRSDAGIVVQTVEHLLSALAGMGITDAFLFIDGPEIPIGDGSAVPFVALIKQAGTCPTRIDVTKAASPTPARIVESIHIQEGDAVIEAFPSSEPGLSLTYELDYGPGAPIPAQSASLRCLPGIGVADYAEQISTARTFCLLDEAVALRKMGLFTSFEPKDLLVIGPDGPIENSYRFPNEPARHKLLDLLGDLSLAGRPVQGGIIARRAGHALNHQMARALAALP